MTGTGETGEPAAFEVTLTTVEWGRSPAQAAMRAESSMRGTRAGSVMTARWNEHHSDIGDWCPWSGAPAPAQAARERSRPCPARCRASRAEPAPDAAPRPPRPGTDPPAGPQLE